MKAILLGISWHFRKTAKNVANTFENTADQVWLLDILILRYLQYFNLKTYFNAHAKSCYYVQCISCQEVSWSYNWWGIYLKISVKEETFKCFLFLKKTKYILVLTSKESLSTNMEIQGVIHEMQSVWLDILLMVFVLWIKIISYDHNNLVKLSFIVQLIY